MSLAPAGANRQRAAFTLLELLVVIALIALLAGLVLGAARSASQSSRIARTKAELAALAAALEAYKQGYGDYPQTDDAARLLPSLLGQRGPTNAVVRGRALIELAKFTASGDPAADTGAVLLDAWGRPYVYAYRTPASGWTNPAFVLYSAGPDGRDAGLLAGGLVDASAPDNADNLYANR